VLKAQYRGTFGTATRATALSENDPGSGSVCAPPAQRPRLTLDAGSRGEEIDPEGRQYRRLVGVWHRIQQAEELHRLRLNPREHLPDDPVVGEGPRRLGSRQLC
jgi:hypothetical protein